MTCSICHSSLFHPTGQRTTENSGSSSTNNSEAPVTVSKYQPAALGCGHTFHKACVQRWFNTSNRTGCPICQKVHDGPILVLYIDTDDADVTAPPKQTSTTLRFSSSPATGTSATGENNSSNSSGNPRKGVSVDRPDTAAQPLEDGRNELLDRIEELETLLDRQTRIMEQQHIREKHRLEAQLFAKEVELLNLKEITDEQQALIDELKYEASRFECRSEGHRNHIRSLQRKLADCETRVEELTEELEGADEETDELEEKIEEVNADVARLEIKADGQRRHINSLQRKLQTAEDDLYEANRKVSRLDVLSDAHRSHINSLQKAVEDKKAIISELEDELCSESDDDYYDDDYYDDDYY